MRPRSLALLALLALAACKKDPPARPRPQTPAAADASTTATPANDPTTPAPSPPSNSLATFRGAGLRKVLSLVAPGAPAGVVLGQMAPGFSPGLGEHGVDIDPDGAFAVVMVLPDGERPQASFIVGWPLRAGMPIAQDAQAGRGYRQASPGLYEPTSAPTRGADGGVVDNVCWVARRPPVGWMLLCGPSALVRPAANYLVYHGSHPPSPETVLDVTVRPEAARRLMAINLALLETLDPRRMRGQDAGRAGPTQAQYDEQHRALLNTKQLVDDLSALRGTVTLDETAYHVRMDGEFANATGSSSRALINSVVGRHSPAELLRRLPASAQAYYATGFDMQALSPLLAPVQQDPQFAQVMGPELTRLRDAVHDLIDLRAGGERTTGFLTDGDGSTIQVSRLADPVAALNRLRTAAAAVPRARRPSGVVPADFAAVLPTTGLPEGSLRLRLGPNPARMPPNTPEPQRRQAERSVLFVPGEGVLTVVEARDPLAVWRAAQAGEHLAPTVEGAPAALFRVTPASFPAVLGVPPQLAEAMTLSSTDAITGQISATRAGDSGARFEARVDAPITALNQIRELYGRLQEAQAQALQQMRQQMEAARRAQAAAQRRQQQQPSPGGGLQPPTGYLPDPDFQLRVPQ